MSESKINLKLIPFSAYRMRTDENEEKPTRRFIKAVESKDENGNPEFFIPTLEQLKTVDSRADKGNFCHPEYNNIEHILDRDGILVADKSINFFTDVFNKLEGKENADDEKDAEERYFSFDHTTMVLTPMNSKDVEDFLEL